MKKLFSGLTPSTFLLGLSSLFGDISTEMLYPVLPVFLTDVLKAPASIIGIIEGVATAIQYTIQGVSGWLSDKLHKRKSIALFGYALAAFAKPLIGLATIWPQVLIGRFSDRLGAGTRSAPRDALIAASATEKSRGKAFGLEGIGDNLGACIGPLIAVWLLFTIHINIRYIFYLAFIPGILALFMMILVHSPRRAELVATPPVKNKLELKSLRQFSSQYWKYLGVTALFGLGNMSNAFLILRTKQIGIPLETTILIYAGFNLVAAISSYPAGYLSDILGRKNVLLTAFLVFIAVYVGFAFTTSLPIIGVLFMLYGVHTGIYRAVGKALATDFVSEELRASGVGWYSTVIGLSGLVASIIAGQLWTNLNPQSAFIYGLVFAILGSAALVILIPRKR